MVAELTVQCVASLCLAELTVQGVASRCDRSTRVLI
jgi:hypothetical protein